VKRHGAVVLGVCRRVTGHHQDAEDAFQAVFLILARKALSIRNPEVLGSWLHGVAQRVAQTTRRSALRRNAREVLVSAVPDRPDPSAEAIDEPCPYLDEELANLPAWYRDAIVLCDMQGLSRGEAASLLGVPEGTLSSRLANGRRKLAARLAKRGFVFSIAAFSTTLSASRAAAASSELFVKTYGFVDDWLAGTEIPRPLSRLVQGGMAMRKAFFFCLFATAVAVTGVVLATQPRAQAPVADQPGKTRAAVKPPAGEQTADEPKKTNDASFDLSSRPRLSKAVDLAAPTIINSVVWNEQGTKLAIGGMRLEEVLVQDSKGKINSITRPLMTICAVTVASLEPYTFHAWGGNSLIGFTADGKSVLTEIQEPLLVNGFHKLDVWSTSEPEKEAEKESEGPTARRTRPLCWLSWKRTVMACDWDYGTSRRKPSRRNEHVPLDTFRSACDRNQWHTEQGDV
jgi:RNA polymerase sigma factor (sigma-70 family)